MWGWGPAHPPRHRVSSSSRPKLNNQISGCLLSVGDGGGSLGNIQGFDTSISFGNTSYSGSGPSEPPRPFPRYLNNYI
jgi:hypothetical protein